MVVPNSDKGHEEVSQYLLVARILVCCLAIEIHHFLLCREMRVDGWRERGKRRIGGREKGGRTVGGEGKKTEKSEICWAVRSD